VLRHRVDQCRLAILDLCDRPLERGLEIVCILDGAFGPPAHRAGEADEAGSRSKQIHADMGAARIPRRDTLLLSYGHFCGENRPQRAAARSRCTRSRRSACCSNAVRSAAAIRPWVGRTQAVGHRVIPFDRMNSASASRSSSDIFIPPANSIHGDVRLSLGRRCGNLARGNTQSVSPAGCLTLLVMIPQVAWRLSPEHKSPTVEAPVFPVPGLRFAPGRRAELAQIIGIQVSVDHGRSV
jgi:hypothetical protein